MIHDLTLEQQRECLGFGEDDRVVFKNQNVSIESINWGGHDDPKKAGIHNGDIFRVESVEIHDSYSRVCLEGVKGGFNSIWFDRVQVDAKGQKKELSL